MRGGRYLIALAALGAGWPAQASAQEATLPATPREITFGSTPIGPVFADAEGYTLYVTRRDAEPGMSTCFGPCASEWPPVRASADGARPFGDWSLVARADGAPQWAYRGRPLYRYRQEEEKNWAIGQGNVWQIAAVDPFPVRGGRRRSYLRAGVRQTRFDVEGAPPGIVAETTHHGVVLADAQGMTLYAAAACQPACAGIWAPLRAPAAAVPFGDWSVAARVDGVAQWVYRGQPLYGCTRDVTPGEATCVADGGRIVEVPPALIVTDGNGG